MLQQIDHIGIAVKNLDETLAFYRQVMGLEVSSTEVFNGMKIAFLRVGDSELELLEDLTPDGAIARHVAKRGEGIQHVAYRVDHLERALQEMRAKGIELIDEQPRPGARNARVAFLHPKSTKGVLIEFVEPQGSSHP
ncbi:MAG TPA: methylmalonyl-CoA epimerase [Candidatus Tectomicrobia bacterium]|nr:methylmalonyl-CoA epimerase [Candidatus Tectomicrobia bacterium]